MGAGASGAGVGARSGGACSPTSVVSIVGRSGDACGAAFSTRALRAKSVTKAARLGYRTSGCRDHARCSARVSPVRRSPIPPEAAAGSREQGLRVFSVCARACEAFERKRRQYELIDRRSDRRAFVDLLGRTVWNGPFDAVWTNRSYGMNEPRVPDAHIETGTRERHRARIERS